MDENGEILLLHASKHNAGLFVLPFYMTLKWPKNMPWSEIKVNIQIFWEWFVLWDSDYFSLLAPWKQEYLSFTCTKLF